MMLDLHLLGDQLALVLLLFARSGLYGERAVRPGFPRIVASLFQGTAVLLALLDRNAEPGAVLFGLLHGFDGFTAEGNMGQNFFGDQGTGYAWWAALLLETVMTMVLPCSRFRPCKRSRISLAASIAILTRRGALFGAIA